MFCFFTLKLRLTRPEVLCIAWRLESKFLLSDVVWEIDQSVKGSAIGRFIWWTGLYQLPWHEIHTAKLQWDPLSSKGQSGLDSRDPLGKVNCQLVGQARHNMRTRIWESLHVASTSFFYIVQLFYLPCFVVQNPLLPNIACF